MCGHFAINYIRLVQLIQRYGLDDISDLGESDFPEINHFYPSRGQNHVMVPVVFQTNGTRKLDFFRWDLIPQWWNKSLPEKKFATFNARSDSLKVKATFRGAWSRCQRCILPVTEFFEWPDKKRIVPGTQRKEQRIYLPDQDIFSLAGIWDECRVKDSTLKSCAIITTDANPLIADIPHTRMPVILPEEKESLWLDPGISAEEAGLLLQPFSAESMQVEKNISGGLRYAP